MNPIVIVTGASHGIGAATARLFAAEGYDVCINYLSDTATASSVVADCTAVGARAVAVQGDVGKIEDIRAPVPRLRRGAGAGDLPDQQCGDYWRGLPD